MACLKGKVAVVIGDGRYLASPGDGQASTFRFMQEGASVLAVGRIWP